MSTFLSVPILGLLLVLQSAVVSRMPLLHGAPDLVLVVLMAWAVQARVKTMWQWSVVGGLMVSLVSALPMAATFTAYMLATGIAVLVRRWLWQLPLLAMITATLAGTLITHTLAVLALILTGTPIPLNTALDVITLPSAFLNLVLAIPLYGLISDLANWVYPEEIEI